MVNENYPYSSSEMLCGTSLCLSGEYFHLSKKSHSPSTYEVHSISFQTFFVQAFIIAVNSRYFSMLLLYSL